MNAISDVTWRRAFQRWHNRRPRERKPPTPHDWLMLPMTFGDWSATIVWC